MPSLFAARKAGAGRGGPGRVRQRSHGAGLCSFGLSAFGPLQLAVQACHAGSGALMLLLDSRDPLARPVETEGLAFLHLGLLASHRIPQSLRLPCRGHFLDYDLAAGQVGPGPGSPGLHGNVTTRI